MEIPMGMVHAIQANPITEFHQQAVKHSIYTLKTSDVKDIPVSSSHAVMVTEGNHGDIYSADSMEDAHNLAGEIAYHLYEASYC